jgi:hypothetical protein
MKISRFNRGFRPGASVGLLGAEKGLTVAQGMNFVRDGMSPPEKGLREEGFLAGYTRSRSVRNSQ